jgi:hypothetical protein
MVDFARATVEEHFDERFAVLRRSVGVFHHCISFKGCQ